MNNICDVLEMKIIAHYLLVLNKCLFEAALNWKFFIVMCLFHEAACETQATQDHHGTRRLSGHRAALHHVTLRVWGIGEGEREPFPGALEGLGS